MSDGTRLRQAWSDALAAAENNFRQLLVAGEWKHVSLVSDSPSPQKGKARVSLNPELTDVVVHRKTTKSGEYVFRVVLDVPATDDSAVLDAWKAVVTTPELRQEWDPAVEGASLVEMFDQRTRIAKTQFTLGWPANPRDAVTISRLHQDASTIIDVSTSLPRSADEPAYLRPSPPYVRSHVELFTWCIQYAQSSSPISSSPSDALRRRLSSALPRLRISCFWQHDLRSVWNLGSTSTVCQQLSTMILGLYKIVKKRGSKVPTLAGYGYGLSVERVRFRLDRQALTVEYLVHLEEDGGEEDNGIKNLDELREHRRLTRSIEFLLPTSEGWDVQVTAKAPSERVEKLPWTATAVRGKPTPPPGGVVKPLELTVLRIMHASLPDAHSILKVRVVFELSGPSSGIRLNGLPQTIQAVEERDPSSMSPVQQQLLQDASSMADASFQTASSVSSVGTIGSSNGTPQVSSRLVAKDVGERPAAVEKSILSRVKRSYIYFSSLLQEPEAKWKRTTEARGVSVTQLDSIDPTLVVYRAEATFVGLGLWDLYGALVSPGARAFWDKQYDDAILLEDVNELTELWHFKTKPAWPVFGRDMVLLKTVYKSPTTIHVFAFSADDPYLFPSLPPSDPNFIRAQVDLQGWAIEALSPSTTQLTLLEQSDPKGWSNKATTIPAQMVGAVAGVGDFVIKCGGPPVVTRLAGARALEMRYDHEKGLFRVAYEGSEGRRSGLNGVNGANGSITSGGATADASTSAGATTTTATATATTTTTTTTTDVLTIECEIRCDLDTWASSLDIVVDPPPQYVTALRRHRLSSLGGGLWLTFTHDALFASDERLLVIVRRGPMSSARDKGAVMVNGARVPVDVEELPETEIKALSKQKRVRPTRVPLDQPPVVSAIRRRRAEWDADGASPTTTDGNGRGDAGATTTAITTAAMATNSAESSSKSAAPEPPDAKLSSASSSSSPSWLSTPKFSSPLASFWFTAVEQATSTTQNAVAAITPASASAGTSEVAAPSASKPPLQHAAEALHWLRELHTRPEEGWTPVSDKGQVSVKRKLIPDVSALVPVHKGEKVIEGVSAEEVSSVVASYACRRAWDDRFASAVVLEQFGARCHTAFVASKGGFPFRDRGFLVASVLARSKLPRGASLDDKDVGVGIDGGSGSSSGSGSGNDSGNGNGNGGGGSGIVVGNSTGERIVLFCVSASFHPESAAAFSPAKYNPQAYPIGRVYVDGWALETLDPYTKENYAIPSTRVTRVVAVDYAGSIPAAMNSMMNAGLARAVGAVEMYVKGMSPLPFVRLPAAGLVLSEHKAASAGVTVDVGVPAGVGVELLGGSSAAWKVKRRDEQRTLIASRYDPAERVYTGCVFLTTSTGGGSNSVRSADESTPRSSKITFGSPSNAELGLSSPPSAAVGSPGQRRTSSASVSARSTSAERNRSTSASASVFTVKGELKHSTDLVVAELIVDTKLYPEGYDVAITSTVRESAKYISLAPLLSSSQVDAGASSSSGSSSSSSSSVVSTSSLPVSTHIYTVPASPLHSSGLIADRPPRHLLRLMLPTAQYQISTVQDPLTGETRGALPKPQWYLDLQDKGYVVQVHIRPSGNGRYKVMNNNNGSDGGGGKKQGGGGEVPVRVGDVAVGVANEKASLTALGRDELQDDRVSRMMLLQRTADDEDVFPDELRVPLGRADYMLDDTAIAQVTDVADDSTTKESESSPQQEDSDKLPVPDSPENGDAVQTLFPTAAPGGLLGFLNAYPIPFTLWTSPPTKTNSPQGRSPSGPSSLALSRRSSGVLPKVPGGLGDDDDTTRKSDTAPTGSPSSSSPSSSSFESLSSPPTTSTPAPTPTSGRRGRSSRSPKTYSLSVVLVVALIAFLIGSLLRSLLSPADFIYVVTDSTGTGTGRAAAMEEVQSSVVASSGWREIRRLVEVKYIVGGWDFQIAVVRRH